VLEIGDAAYTRQFGGDRITKSDVLHVVEGNPEATIIGDLTNADHIPSDSFDCFMLTQTLQFIYDIRAAVKTIYRILKPGGVVLATVGGISQVPGDEWGDYLCWSFTRKSAQQLFEEVFPQENIQVETFGNVLVAIAFLQGLAAEELLPEELDAQDPQYQLCITIRAIKPEVTS
jgi:SAM-dependent methyltransferase